MSSQGEPKTCTQCNGRGWIDNRCATEAQATLCSFCNGTGQTVTGKECYSCHGTGQIETRMEDKLVCPTCAGAGVNPRPQSMTIEEYAYRPGKK
jgi:DnaJ-class molecular chaperone